VIAANKNACSVKTGVFLWWIDVIFVGENNKIGVIKFKK
jgi:hypothetical protein